MRLLVLTFLSFLLLLLLLQRNFCPAAAAHRDIIVETCKKCAESSPNVDYKLCVDTLGSVSKSHHSDLRGLGIISLKLAIANATNAKNKLKKLLKAKPHDHHMKSCLQTCKELYSDSISSLKDSIKAIKDKRYNDANVYISSAVDAPGTCEDGFEEGNFESPVRKENKDFFRLAVISLAITALLE